MAFRSSILGGVYLLREAIRSRNYVSGSAGWTINQDGSAEFNNVVIRGGTVVSGTALYYNGTPALGNLILSIAAAAGVDSYGNAYQAGLTSYSADGSINLDDNVQTFANTAGAEISIGIGGAQASMLLTPPAVVGVTWGRGSLGSLVQAPNNTPQTFIAAPYNTSFARQAVLRLFGGNSVSNTTAATLSADTFDVSGNLTAGNVESGTAQTPAPGGVPAQTSVAVLFSKTFTAVPRVQLTPNSNSANLNTANIRWAVTNKTTAGFTINCWRDTNNATNFEWEATLY